MIHSPLFVWVGYDRHGRRRSGRARAVSAQVVRERLAQCVVVTGVYYSWWVLCEPGWWHMWWQHLRARTLLPIVTVGLLCQGLATLLRAGVSLDRAIKTLITTSADRRISFVLRQVSAALRAGESFHQALLATRGWWPVVLPTAVGACQGRGELVAVLTQLAESLAVREQYRKKMVQALSVPLLTACVAIVVVIAMTVMVLPLLGNLFPAATVVTLQWYATFLRQYGLLLLWLLVAGVAAVWRMLACWPGVRRWRDGFIYSVPGVGRLCAQVHAISMVRLLAVLVSAGVPLRTAVLAVAAVPGNAYWQWQMQQVAARLLAGCSIEVAFKQPVMPVLVVHMLALVHGAQRLPVLCQQAAFLLSARVHHTLNVRLALLQPFLLLSIGALVLWGLATILGPLLDSMAGF